MMVGLLLYGYANGVYSSRKIEKRTFEDVAFRSLAGDQHLWLAKITSAFIFIAFQLTPIGRSNRLLTVKNWFGHPTRTCWEAMKLKVDGILARDSSVSFSATFP
jgi:Transposase domain (DUF772)